MDMDWMDGHGLDETWTGWWLVDGWMDKQGHTGTRTDMDMDMGGQAGQTKVPRLGRLVCDPSMHFVSYSVRVKVLRSNQ